MATTQNQELSNLLRLNQRVRAGQISEELAASNLGMSLEDFNRERAFEEFEIGQFESDPGPEFEEVPLHQMRGLSGPQASQIQTVRTFRRRRGPEQAAASVDENFGGFTPNAPAPPVDLTPVPVPTAIAPQVAGVPSSQAPSGGAGGPRGFTPVSLAGGAPARGRRLQGQLSQELFRNSTRKPSTVGATQQGSTLDPTRTSSAAPVKSRFLRQRR